MRSKPDAQNTSESRIEAPAQPKRDSELSSDLGVETPATGLENVIYENCKKAREIAGFIGGSRGSDLRESISAALREAYEQGRKSENEECAKICEQYQEDQRRSDPFIREDAIRIGAATVIIDRIRSRLQKEGE